MSPSIDKVLQVAQYLGVSLDELTGINSSETGNSFITVLKRRTEDEDSPLKWEMSDQYICIEELMESEGIEEYEVYVCRYGEGVFLLLNISGDDESGIRLYILPEQNSVPVREQGSADELEGLWYAVEAVCQEKMSIEKVNALKKKFLKEFG